MESVKTNDLKKGMWVLLAIGWLAQIADNKKGNIRMATVYGLYTEMGSIYAWDIVAKLADDTRPEAPGWVKVANIELTPKQVKDRDRIKAAGW